MPGAVTDADQIRFLLNIQRLLNEGLFTASYKYALLMALADLAVETGADSGEPLTLTTRDIAVKFIEYYWRQAAPFVITSSGQGGVVLRQNSDRQAAVIRLVADFRARYGDSITSARHHTAAWWQLVTEVDQVVRVMPLWKLQVVGRTVFDFLYEQTRKGNAITLRPGVAFGLRQFHGLITELVHSAWARQVRQYNLTDLGDTADLHEFLFGTERVNLAPVRDILTDLQRGTCFYCGVNIKGQPEVDHFIPWAVYPLDLGHNFVLADRRCNSAKRDLLAATNHLEKWVRRNTEYGSILGAAFEHAGVAHSLPSTLRVARWAYGHAAAGGGLTWQARDALVPLPGHWTQLLIAD